MSVDERGALWPEVVGAALGAVCSRCWQVWWRLPGQRAERSSAESARRLLPARVCSPLPGIVAEEPEGHVEKGE